MCPKGTLSERTERNLETITRCFVPYLSETLKTGDLTAKTRLSRKQVWSCMRHLIRTGCVERVKKGQYRAKLPGLSEFRKKMGWDEVRLTVDELIAHMKDFNVPQVWFKEQTAENPATLDLYLLDADEFGLVDYRKEQDLHHQVERTIQIVRGMAQNPKRVRVRKVIGFLSWEEKLGEG